MFGEINFKMAIQKKKKKKGVEGGGGGINRKMVILFKCLNKKNVLNYFIHFLCTIDFLTPNFEKMLLCTA